ncbi:hypothetical protein BDN67DRAFT_975019 [Paxillus ammoniavirescens]|nr:hypothetical protein BDN67DRAFT_975019 [Paxillus ammoniavirescens]
MDDRSSSPSSLPVTCQWQRKSGQYERVWSHSRSPVLCLQRASEMAGPPQIPNNFLQYRYSATEED